MPCPPLRYHEPRPRPPSIIPTRPPFFVARGFNRGKTEYELEGLKPLNSAHAKSLHQTQKDKFRPTC
jgi:hypothetical protein